MCESCSTGDTLWLIAFSSDRREVVPVRKNREPTRCWFWIGSRRFKVQPNNSALRSKRQRASKSFQQTATRWASNTSSPAEGEL